MNPLTHSHRTRHSGGLGSWHCAIAVFGLLVGTVAPGSASEAQRAGRLEPLRPTVAVSKFAGLAKFDLARGGSGHSGGGLSAILTSALQASGRFLVVERTQLVDVMAEQQLGSNKLVQKEGRALPGALIGAQWIVTGHVTEFGIAEKGSGLRIGTSVGGGNLGVAPRKQVGTVVIDVRVLDAVTGTVVTSLTARESIKARSLGFTFSGRDMEIGGDKFQRTAVGRATRAAIEQVVEHLVAEIDRTPWQGRVVGYDSGEVVLNAGAEAGVRVGQEFRIVRLGAALTDPVSGELLGHRRREVGTFRVTEVEGRLAFGPFLSGSTALEPDRNDVVRLIGHASSRDLDGGTR